MENYMKWKLYLAMLIQFVWINGAFSEGLMKPTPRQGEVTQLGSQPCTKDQMGNKDASTLCRMPHDKQERDVTQQAISLRK
jgi:hypothetical protein